MCFQTSRRDRKCLRSSARSSRWGCSGAAEGPREARANVTRSLTKSSRLFRTSWSLLYATASYSTPLSPVWYSGTVLVCFAPLGETGINMGNGKRGNGAKSVNETQKGAGFIQVPQTVRLRTTAGVEFKILTPKSIFLTRGMRDIGVISVCMIITLSSRDSQRDVTLGQRSSNVLMYVAKSEQPLSLQNKSHFYTFYYCVSFDFCLQGAICGGWHTLSAQCCGELSLIFGGVCRVDGSCRWSLDDLTVVPVKGSSTNSVWSLTLILTIWKISFWRSQPGSS